MKRLVTCALLVAGCVAPDLLACGDKFLVPGRGTLFQRTPAARQASAVLMYAPPESELARTMSRLNVEPSIRKVGYRPTVVTSLGDLDRVAPGLGDSDRVAPGQRWDVLVFDLADGQAIRDRMRGKNQPTVLPVAQKLTGVQFSQAKAQFAMVLKAPSRNQDFLDAIDDAVAATRAEQAKSLGKSQ